ncbi:hypothetical protein ACFT2C_12285 [Promicromonospora sp. NPDC057138]|uniref:hypothetical protein n=1 Tax=Promicromonospora sp. NPDC057138 TaxID=3346031 RepID=UPI003641B789
MAEVNVLAAYRDLYRVAGDSLLGEPPTTLTQRYDARRIDARVQNQFRVGHRDRFSARRAEVDERTIG